MIPTRGDVKTAVLQLLDDYLGATYDNSSSSTGGKTIFDVGFASAYDALFNAFWNAQAARIELITTHNLATLATSFTPADAGILDFNDPIELQERLQGSTDKYTTVTRLDQLPQRLPVNALLEFVWRFDTFFFIGATTPRTLQITYESSGTAPVADGTSINVDGSLNFLTWFTVGLLGRVKGDIELADYYMSKAVGPKFDMGTAGGELFRIIQPRVRDRQNVQLALKPYSASRRLFRRSLPYIQAQQPAGTVNTPAIFSTYNSTITGDVDGINNSFFLSYPVTQIAGLTVNGVGMTPGEDYVFGANLIQFTPTSIPQPIVGGTTVITCQGWV